MKPIEIKKGIYSIGMQDPDLRIFDVIMKTEYGTSYNSYLVEGSEKVVIFETVKSKFFDEYLEKIKKVSDINKIEYIVANHTEPDHAGSIEGLLRLNPAIKLVGTSAAIKFLKQIVNLEFEAIEAKETIELDLGGKTIKFIMAPFLHWPDSMYSYIQEDKLLITCDSFGCHYSSDRMFTDEIEKDPLAKKDFLNAYKYYYDMIMGPFKPYVLKALDKISNLDIDMICTGHGPILRTNLQDYLDLYRQWSTITKIDDSIHRVVIAYVSAYGYTTEIGNKIAEGIKSTGTFEIYSYDIIHFEKEDILEKIYWSDGVLFGSPTINGDALKPVWDILTSLNPLVHGRKIAAAFGSYGWSGEAVPYIEDRLKQLRMKLLSPGLKIEFKPSSSQLQQAYEFGQAFGEKILESKVKK